LLIENNLKKHNAEMKRLVGNLSSDTNINSPDKSRMADLLGLIINDENRLKAKIKRLNYCLICQFIFQ